MPLKIPSRLQFLTRRPVIRIEPIRKMEGFELERFLLDFSTEDMRQMNLLWAKYAGRKDLIKFKANEKNIRA